MCLEWLSVFENQSHQMKGCKNVHKYDFVSCIRLPTATKSQLTSELAYISKGRIY